METNPFPKVTQNCKMLDIFPGVIPIFVLVLRKSTLRIILSKKASFELVELLMYFWGTIKNLKQTRFNWSILHYWQRGVILKAKVTHNSQFSIHSQSQQYQENESEGENAFRMWFLTDAPGH